MAAFLWLLESPAHFSDTTERESAYKDKPSALFMYMRHTDLKFAVYITCAWFIPAAQRNG